MGLTPAQRKHQIDIFLVFILMGTILGLFYIYGTGKASVEGMDVLVPVLTLVIGNIMARFTGGHNNGGS